MNETSWTKFIVNILDFILNFVCRVNFTSLYMHSLVMHVCDLIKSITLQCIDGQIYLSKLNFANMILAAIMGKKRMLKLFRGYPRPNVFTILLSYRNSHQTFICWCDRLVVYQQSETRKSKTKRLLQSVSAINSNYQRSTLFGWLTW